MAEIIDLTGKIFGSITVLRRVDNEKNGQPVWEGICICGVVKTYRGSRLRYNERTDCGCLLKQKLAKASTIHGEALKGRETSEYKAWHHMWTRVKDLKKAHIYKDRGIIVCERWKKYENFLADMGRMPEDKRTLDRIDVNGNYEKSNCRWADIKEQRNNTRSTPYLTYKGETKPLMYWAEELNISPSLLRSRCISRDKDKSKNKHKPHIDQHIWTDEEILTLPSLKKIVKKGDIL